MADDADRAQQETEFLLAAALRRSRVTHKPTGFCIECEEEIPTIDGDPPKLFCCIDCRNLFEKREKMKRIAGE
jgi:RNA polymerase-binding transcription factor DksA